MENVFGKFFISRKFSCFKKYDFKKNFVTRTGNIMQKQEVIVEKT